MSFRSRFFSTFSRGVPAAVAGALATTAQPASPPAPAVQLSAVSVTATREKAPLAETPLSVGAIASEAIRQTAPLHPSELLGQVPGVAVAVTNGEGHTTAIRQPFTTSPVYLFLEDGIPVRATGFFNHNALYEVNLPLAGGIEVIRGPGSALYGSDAVGGIVNLLSRPPPPSAQAALRSEAGSFGTWRLTASGGGPLGAGPGGVQLDVNATHAAGWREHTGYDRRSANLRLDRPLGRAATLKTIVGLARIAQDTGANSPLTFADYLQHPTRNYLPIAYRRVEAARVSVEYEQQFDTAMISVIPFFRDNAMELNGTYNLSSDPRIERTHNVSCGLLAKWRQNLPLLRARLIGGVDLDYSPGSRQEDNLLVTRAGSGAATVYSAYAPGTRVYDYRVVCRSVAPYFQAELSPVPPLRVTAGLRHDTLRYRMENRLGGPVVSAVVLGARRFYGQLGNSAAVFSRASPKLGATYSLGKHAHLYGSWNFGFRAPAEGQLYRAGGEPTVAGALTRARLAQELKPIKARQAELGLRASFPRWSYQVVAYQLDKRDDLVSQRDLSTNVTTLVNAGRTEHRGIEAGVGVQLGAQLRLDAALSRARHRYVRWVTAAANFSGREIEAAPHVLANTRLTWRAGAATTLQAEWVRIGAYWLEAGNSALFGKYPGHDLVNFRAQHRIGRHLGIFARVMNVADRRFAESAQVTSNTPVFSPGLPRAVYGGLEFNW